MIFLNVIQDFVVYKNKNMKIKISQSMLRDFYNPDYCKIKWEETYLNGFRTKPTASMLDGLVHKNPPYQFLKHFLIVMHHIF